jgi:iron complex outermembrane receptor protein
MNTLPGVFVQEGAFNTQRITSRGIGNRSPFSSTRIRAYLDQIPLTNGSGETLLEDFAPSSFQEATFVKGPKETRYGTPLGGNFLLRSLPENALRNRGSLGLSVGSFGLVNADGQFLLTDGKGQMHRLTAGIVHSQGYRENNRYDRQQLLYSGKVAHRTRKQETRFLLAFNRLEAQIPSSLGRTDYLEDPRQAAFPWKQIEGFEDYYRLVGGVSHRIRLWEGEKAMLENTTSLFGQFRDNYELRPFNLLEESDAWYGLRTNFRLEENENWTAQMGGEFFWEQYAWKTSAIVDLQPDSLLSDNREQRRHLNLFLEGEAQWGKWKATLGASLQISRYDYRDLFLTGPENRSADFSFAPVFSPALNLEYKLDKGSIYANISRGFALPTLEETLLPDGQRNPDIQPETGWNIELAVEQDDLFGRLALGLVIYHLRVRNLLVTRRTAEDAFLSINAGTSNHTGLETNGSLKWFQTPRQKLTLDWVYNFNLHRFGEFLDDQNDFSGNELTGSPPHNLLIGLNYLLRDRFHLRLAYRFVDAFPMNDGNTAYSDAYQLLDLSLAYDWPIDGERRLKKISTFLFFGNLTNARYAAMISINAVGFGGNEPRYYYPGLPFHFRGGVRIHFQQPD